MKRVLIGAPLFVAVVLVAEMCAGGLAVARAEHCLAPRSATGCESHSLSEVSVGAPLVASDGGRGWQTSYSLGWIYDLDDRVSAGPIVGIGYETESGYLANVGLRLRAPLDVAWSVDVTPGMTLQHLDRSATRATAGYLDLTLARKDSVGVGARFELGRPADKWNASAHLTLRVGSYVGLAVGTSAVVLVFVLSNLQLSS